MIARNNVARRAVAAALGLALLGTSAVLPATAMAETGEPSLAPAKDESFPARFDLRDRGVVTPVKSQDPWATCWSFGAIAASETSILSDTGATFASTGLDLSERHLIWFGLHPITAADEPSQAGEGLSVYGRESEPNAVFRTARPIVSSSLLSTGVGPMDEESFPYRNNEWLTEYNYMLNNKDEWKRGFEQEVVSSNGGQKTLEQLLREANNPETPDQFLERRYNEILAKYKDEDVYSTHGDWSLSDKDRNLSLGYTLIDGNTLPTSARRASDGTWAGYNERGTQAIKEELQDGHAVAVAFCADTSLPSEDPTKQGKYLNLKTWAHYTYDNATPNHMVTIVGWDDTYSKYNFLAGTDEGGNSKTPPADGAWIVKNSWGNSTDYALEQDDRPIGKSNWGVDGSGYFYLSYYDKSLKDAESMRYGSDLNADSFSVYQYDYMPATDGFYFETGADRISTANVYKAEGDEVLTSVGTRTYAENTTVEFEVHRLGEGVTNPEGGELLSAFSYTFEYGGFHRVALPERVTLPNGTRFSVVCTGYVTTDDGGKNYGLAANKADSLQYARKHAEKGNAGRVYGTAVVNKGESYFCKGGQWYDWAEYLSNDMTTDGLATQALDGGDTVVDNFTAKAYALPADKASEVKDPAPVGEKIDKSDNKTPDEEKSNGGQDDGQDGGQDGGQQNGPGVEQNGDDGQNGGQQNGQQGGDSSTPKDRQAPARQATSRKDLPKTADDTSLVYVPVAVVAAGAIALGLARRRRA